MKTRTDALESSAPVSLGGVIILPHYTSMHNLLPRPFQKLAIPINQGGTSGRKLVAHFCRKSVDHFRANIDIK
jgi:hypothetical protein